MGLISKKNKIQTPLMPPKMKPCRTFQPNPTKVKCSKVGGLIFGKGISKKYADVINATPN